MGRYKRERGGPFRQMKNTWVWPGEVTVLSKRAFKIITVSQFLRRKRHFQVIKGLKDYSELKPASVD